MSPASDPEVIFARQRLAAAQGWVTLDAAEARAVLAAWQYAEDQVRQLRADLVSMANRLAAASEVLSRLAERPECRRPQPG